MVTKGDGTRDVARQCVTNNHRPYQQDIHNGFMFDDSRTRSVRYAHTHTRCAGRVVESARLQRIGMYGYIGVHDDTVH
jgi:hypothetical protein